MLTVFLEVPDGGRTQSEYAGVGEGVVFLHTEIPEKQLDGV